MKLLDEPSPSIKSCIIAEKPSVGRDIAKALNVHQKGEGFLYNDKFIVTWAFGHLLTTKEPQEMNPAWTKWRLEDLPIIPQNWSLKVTPNSRKQFEIIKDLISRAEVTELINAMDAGREGELIFRQLYYALQCTKPVRRLWLSALTHTSILQAFNDLKPSSEYNNLATAAICRSRADWLVGINLTRAYTLMQNELYTLGRVQTPTLNLVALRDQEIKNFAPEDYYTIKLGYTPSTDPSASFQAQALNMERMPPTVIDSLKCLTPPKSPYNPKWGHFPTKEQAQILLTRFKEADSKIQLICCEGRTQKQTLDKLLSLTDLQRKANQLFSFSASETLEIAQSLYEQHKLISYPRTNSSFLSTGILDEIPKILKHLQKDYPSITAELFPSKKVPTQYIDDEDAREHHALIPTTKTCLWKNLSSGERKIYDLICRTFLCMFSKPKIIQISEAYFTTKETKTPAIACAKGRQILDEGFESILKFAQWGDPFSQEKASAPKKGESDTASSFEQILPHLQVEEAYVVNKAKMIALKTLPPSHYSEATLLAAMERAGRHIKKSLLKGSMRDFSLGTAATRSQIIESLINRKYLLRKGRQLWATEKAYALLNCVSERIKSPEITGKWEADLESIVRGKYSGKQFMDDITTMIREELQAPGPVHCTQNHPPNIRFEQLINPKTKVQPSVLPDSEHAKLSEKNLSELLKLVWNYDSFRPLQQQACQALLSKKNVLMVMPTGAGKSLCYQLPGIKMGLLTLVISPLISLMEDQCQKLTHLGFNAAALHSQLPLERTQDIWKKLAENRINFLFISPERLSSNTFCREIFTHKLALIAIDEAHCISQWGHDFRPEYRIIGEQLQKWAQETPIIALTATATEQVQEDIVKQLGFGQYEKLISGFYRTNLAITPLETAKNQRIDRIKKILSNPDSMPAIVFAPTRKEADSIFQKLSAALSPRGGIYHAGLDSCERKDAQDGFISGKLSFIVATIAFGMGIDKGNIRTVIHSHLPRNLEAYYQEIGRAGRDSLSANAVLLWSYQDLNHHEYFLGKLRDSLELLDELYAKIPQDDAPIIEHTRNLEFNVVDSKDDNTQKLLLMLQNLGGITGNIKTGYRRGPSNWRQLFLTHLDTKEQSLKHVIRFLNSDICRMRALCAYFGEHVEKDCGHCDLCLLPQINQHQLSAIEKNAALRLFDSLHYTRERSLGKLYNDICSEKPLSKNHFEVLLSALFKSQLIAIEYRHFQKDKHRVEYQVATMNQKISKKSFKQKLEKLYLQKSE